MSKGKKTELQVSVHSQDQWEDLLQKDGLIVVDAYAAWCGPCKAIVSTLKRLKNELGDDLLHFATAETDNIDALSLYQGKSQPTFLFYSSGLLVHVIRGCNCPVMIKTITSQLEKEHKVLEGKAERTEYIDEVVGAKHDMETDQDEKVYNEEDEKIVSKEVSLAIIKPDAVKAGLVDEIVAKVKSEGMEILRQEERTLTKEEAAEFYRQHEGSEHFEDLVEFMSSGPCMTLIISKGETGEGVIPQFRDLIGPKDVNQAKEEAPNSIRAVYGTSSVMNAIHACDTSENAARELAFFFPDFVSPTVKTKKANRPSSHRTLALIRPDALRHHKDSILDKVKEAGFSIAMAKELTLTREEAEDFYAEHKGKDFFEPLVQNMCSGPVMALCLAREDAVEGWRNLIGPKEVDVAKAEAPESLRAQFHVEDSDINPLHGSDSHSAARREIEKIFPVETTVAVIKPETAEESGDEIVNRIKEAGFRIISRKDVGLTKELASQFYHEHEGKDFFDGLTDYMSSGQSTVLLLEREDAVAGWRTLMGPTDPEEAREKAPDSIRAAFGKDICKNAVHGSTNMDKAERVIVELFPEVEVLPNGRAIENEMQDKEDTMEDVEITVDNDGDNVQEKEIIVGSDDVKNDETGEQNDGNNQDSVRDQDINIGGDTNSDGRSNADDGNATVADDDATSDDSVPKDIDNGKTVESDMIISNDSGSDTNADNGITTSSHDNNHTITNDTSPANENKETTTTSDENTTVIDSSETTPTEDTPKDGMIIQNNSSIDGENTDGILTDESRAVGTPAVPDEDIPGSDTTKDDTEVDKEYKV